MGIFERFISFCKKAWEKNQAGYARMAREKNKSIGFYEKRKLVEEKTNLGFSRFEVPQRISIPQVNLFPYTMDDLSSWDIDILLKQPTMVVLTWGLDDSEKMIKRILDSCYASFGKSALCFLANSVTDTFIMQRTHICQPRCIYGMNETKEIIDLLHKETDFRVKCAASNKQRAYAGVPIYLLLDNFSIIRQKPQEPIVAKLAHIMLCSRQSNIHAIVFDRSDSFRSCDFGWFSSFVFLCNSYREKYRKIIPPNYRCIKDGAFFISPLFGETGVYDI